MLITKQTLFKILEYGKVNEIARLKCRGEKKKKKKTLKNIGFGGISKN